MNDCGLRLRRRWAAIYDEQSLSAGSAVYRNSHAIGLLRP
jgi:hypothetical protein